MNAHLFAFLLGAVVFFLPYSVVRAASTAPVVFVPLDDRPVSLQLPLWLGDIAGRRVLAPPEAAVGSYLTPGDPEAILRWLASPATENADAAVVSADMIAYGGLVASRTPAVTSAVALERLRALAALRAQRARMSLDVFGTIMRLAPTGLPRTPSTASYWAVADTVSALQAYANLHDPPQTPREQAQADALKVKIGQSALDAYSASRARNREMDLFMLDLTAQGAFDKLILGQDDAGPVGLHVRDVAVLSAAKERLRLGTRAAIEPGADELGMVLLASVFARDAYWKPTVCVRYSRAGGESVNDPLEFAPIDTTIARLIEAAGASRVTEHADVELFVEVPHTSQEDENAFLDAIAVRTAQRQSVAIADLTFLNTPDPSLEQQRLAQELIARGSAGSVDAFSSWNTTANTVGTSLAEAIAVGAGKRSFSYNPLAHARFMLDRYIDDYAFHQFVRPVLNRQLRAEGIDPALLSLPLAERASDENRALLRRYALWLLASIYPQYRDAGITMSLPWRRTFETRVEVELSDPFDKFR